MPHYNPEIPLMSVNSMILNVYLELFQVLRKVNSNEVGKCREQH